MTAIGISEAGEASHIPYCDGGARYCDAMTQNPDVGTGTPISLAGLRAGANVGGYRLLRRLGAGGMGVVWEVADGEGNHVAMKILHPQIAADPMARRRLDREASVLARVKDSRVARILDIETGDGADGSGVTFVITELVDGPTLQHEVDYEGAYDLSTDARDLSDLAHGLVDSLSAVHAAGVIHRDLKPSNVMLGVQGPVLIDFGIAQVADDVRLTQTGQVTGTPGFIPPEMLDGDEPSPGVDWYACAGVLLFAVTGRAPFGSGPWQAVFRRVYAGTPELGALEEDCPALARAFVAALAPEAADRLKIEDLLRVLDDIADGGTGQDVVDEVLGDDGEASEADTDTGTFSAAAYGIVSGQQQPAGYGGGPSPSSAGYGGGPSPSSAGTGPRPGVPYPGYGNGAGVSSSGYGPGVGIGPASTGQRPAAYGPGPGSGVPSGGYGPGVSSSGYGPGVGVGVGSAGTGPRPGAYGYLGTPTSGASGPSASSASGAVGAPSRFQPEGGRPATPSTGVRAAAAPAAYAPGSGTGVHPVQPAPSRPAPRPAPTPAPTPMPASPSAPVAPPAPARPTGVQPAVSPAPGGSLPSWAREPRRHPIVMLAVFALLAALAVLIPGWEIIVFVLVLVVAGTVGRAEDARRWRRLENGRVSAGDNARMWAGMPWYLLRSLVASIFAFLPAALIAATVFTIGATAIGTEDGNPTILKDWHYYHRSGAVLFVAISLLVLITWLVPWGAPTRRGGARLVEVVLGDGGGPVIATAVLFAVASGLVILHVMGVLHPAWLAPFFFSEG